MADELPDSVLQEFFVECDEMLSRLSENLSKLEKGQHDNETVNEIYRDMHTLKGTSQLFSFENIAKIAHQVETSLEPLRKTNTTINAHFIDSMYTALTLIEKFWV